MNSFLDRQTVHHLFVDELINSKKKFNPNKDLFIQYVETLLDEKIFPDELLDQYYNKIKPEFDQEELVKKTKETAYEYSNYIKYMKSSYTRFQNRNCPKSSIELPQIISHKELGGRMIK